jgi:hypothetical protein
MDSVRDKIVLELKTTKWLTIKTLARRLGQKRKYVTYVLESNPELFQKKLRSPLNVVKKRPIWHLVTTTDVLF